MKQQDYQIIPYTEEYLQKVCSFEQGIIQGKNIQLQIIKRNFLDRANVFSNRYCCLAVDKTNEVIGSAIGAQTTVKINGKKFSAGIAFDTKVAPAWRNKKVGRMLATDIYKKFFQPNGLFKNFMTAKISNKPVVKLASATVHDIWLYDFSYLTIPTSERIKAVDPSKMPGQQFFVQLFNKEDLKHDFFTELENGLGYFNTSKLYKLKLTKISRLYKLGIQWAKIIMPSKYRMLPGENDVLSFATLYNHNRENISGINQLLARLQSEGIHHLLVCCRNHDSIYSTLKKHSINQYEYQVVSDFSLNKTDELTIDARCL